MEAKQKQQMGLNEITAIRDILMGQQMAEYSDKFEAIEKRLDLLAQKLEETDKKHDAQGKDMKLSLEAWLQKLEELLESKSSELHHKINQISKSDKEKVGKLLADVAQKLVQS